MIEYYISILIYSALSKCYSFVFFMGKHKRIVSNGQIRLQTKRAIKFIAVCPAHKLISHIIRTSHITVVKSICNAALNASQGDIGLSTQQISLYKRYRSSFEFLTCRDVSIEKKRAYLSANHNKVLSSGLITQILSSVLSSIGTSFIIPQEPNVSTCVQKVHPDKQS